ncbi:lipoprotein precursor [Tenacibaculum sp. 190524A02b]|uniref:Lipoprotein n=1 Tax=Tenacibaculum vairaonense TaxID=3137860 RepID=A0ABP1FJB1_9FLAO
MRKIKELNQLLRMVTLVTVVILTACSKESEESLLFNEHETTVKVKNGRLVFKDGEHYSEFTKGTVSLEKEVKDLKGFTSLRETMKKDKESYADFVLDLYNEKGEVQIGNVIILIKDWKQYFIEEANEELLKEVKVRLNKGVSVSDLKGVEAFQIKNIVIPIEAEAQNKTWAGYQYEFWDNGTRVKFIYEAFLDGYRVPIGLGRYTLNAHYGIRTKYEWLHGRWWKPAGDNVYKSVSNLSINVISNHMEVSANEGIIQEESTRNLEYRKTFNSIAMYMNYTITVSGNFYTQVRQAGKPNYSHSQYVYYKESVVL